MIKLTAKINLSEAGGNIASNDINTEPNNIGADVDSVLNTQKEAKSPFIIGFSTLGDGNTYESSLDYYMGSVVSNEYKVFEPAYVLTVEGAGVESLTIVFDATNQQYPTSIIADNITHNYKADYKYTVSLDGTMDSHTITIANWNVANAPLVITGIYASLSLEFDYDKLADLEAQHIDRSNIEEPSYGIYSNTGSMRIIDSNGEIKRYAEKRILRNGLKLTITLSNTLTDTKQVVGVYNTTDWDYDYINNEATCTLGEDLEELQEIQFGGIPLEIGVAKTGRDIYEELHEATPDKFNFIAFSELSAKAQNRLNNIKTSRLFMEGGSLWAEWTKLCEISRGHITNSFDGHSVFEVE